MAGLPVSDSAWRLACQERFGVPPKVDLMRLAGDGAAIRGSVGINSFKRLLADLPPQNQTQDDSGVVCYEVSGSTQTGRRGRVALKVQTVLQLICQRCMHSMPFVVDELAEFELFASERELQSAQSDDDVDPLAPEPMLVSEPIDLDELIEDQLILAVPYVPKHEHCEAAKTTAGEYDDLQERASPFKVLEGFKPKPGR